MKRFFPGDLHGSVLYERGGRTARMVCCLAVLVAASSGVGVRAFDGQEVKKIRFDVVSIKPSAPDADIYKGGGFGVTPNGYHSRIMPLSSVIQMAYFLPFDRTPNWLRNAPSWTNNDRYDIEAKVAPEDVAEWQRLTQGASARRSAVLQEALQVMLAERLKLAAHRVPVEVDGYALVVGKHGAKLEEVTTDEPASDRVMKLLDGGKAVYTAPDRKIPEWTFYQTSMNELQSFMQLNILKPLVNQTGLQGKYHFVLKGRDFSNSGGDEREPDGSNIWELGELGLELKPVKVPSEAVVIDHIERPSEN